MTLTDFLSRLKGVKKCGGYYIAKCPAHGDKHQSLSISEKDGRILVNCHAGCSANAIVGAMGLELKDLFQDSRPQAGKQNRRDVRQDKPKRTDDKQPKPWRQRGNIVASYEYRDDSGELLAVKDRYENKFMSWRHPDGSCGWLDGSGGHEIPLYKHDCIGNPVYLVEGEKDVDTLRAAGLYAVCNPNGAGESWKDHYTDQLKGFDVRVIPDNDDIGRKHADKVCNALIGAAASVKLIDLKELWPEIPNKGDVTDWFEWCRQQGREDEKITQCLTVYADGVPEFTSDSSDSGHLFKPVADFTETEATWLVRGWIPEEQITLLAADGGVGKTSLSCNIIAAISSGGQCILDPEDVEREPRRVLILTTEDSISKKLRKKLRLAGANLNNIIAPDPAADTDNDLQALKFGSPFLEQVIMKYKPALCVFDPIQGYVPPDVNMGARNAMRDCLAPLITLGEKTGCSFLIVCHSNKRRGASGRERVSDSSDIWDIARSVMMAGFTNEGGKDIRYLSNEKNNYAKLQETVLFSIDDHGQIVHQGFSQKRDRDFKADEYSHKEKPEEPLNEKLLSALQDAASPFDAVRFSYTDFEEEYGATIYGGKQPKKALDAMKPYMEDAGYSLVVKQVKIDGKNTKGFVIQPVNDEEPSQLTV